jgi:hypothetical protein
MPRRWLEVVVAATRFRVPSWGPLLSGLLVPAIKWLLLWGAALTALSLGPRTPLGSGLLGATVPLLVLEALSETRRRWRKRLLDTLGFAAPTCTLLVLWSVWPGSCCFCDQSPGARQLRNVEFVSDFLYFNALSVVPVFALFVVLRRRSAPVAEQTAYAQTAASALLATLSATVAFGGFIHLLKAPGW